MLVLSLFPGVEMNTGRVVARAVKNGLEQLSPTPAPESSAGGSPKG